MSAILTYTLGVFLVVGFAGGQWTDNDGVAVKASDTPAAEVEAQLERLIDDIAVRHAELEKEHNLAYWKATTTGEESYYDRASQTELAIRALLSDTKRFEFLKKARESGQVRDPLMRRQLEVLYLEFMENQVEPELLEKIVLLSTEIQKAFNDYRGQLDGKKVADNDIDEILKSARESGRRKAAWEAYKARGVVLRDRVLELVRLRNIAARKLGFGDYYQMRLAVIEQDPSEIKRIFDDLAARTDAPFRDLMKRINASLAERYGITPEEMRPWHYEDPFFQEAPALGKLNLDELFKDHDPRSVVETYFKGIGLDPAGILARSDLYEKEGKMPHAYCMDVDRKGDVRILANLRPSEKWTSTLMHEMGHAVYDKYIDSALPWFLREPSHSLTTEAVAELFGRFTRSPVWLAKNLEAPADKLDPVASDIRDSLRVQMLIFARWSMVMMCFERELYHDPEQDLNRLWWTLKTRYQSLTPPEGRDAPDWASKVHVAAWPAYYHNYLLGEMMASQMMHYVGTKLAKQKDWTRADYTGVTQFGDYLREKIFKPGKSLRWDTLIETATGETLNPRYFAEQFVRE
jgi:peptidyl-dipeptidase A